MCKDVRSSYVITIFSIVVDSFQQASLASPTLYNSNFKLNPYIAACFKVFDASHVEFWPVISVAITAPASIIAVSLLLLNVVIITYTHVLTVLRL